MGNDNKTIRSKINNLTVLCENLWPILYYLGGPLLALSSGSSRMYRKSTDKLYCSLSLFYGLKLQLILVLTVLLSLPINDLPEYKGYKSNFKKFIGKKLIFFNLHLFDVSHESSKEFSKNTHSEVSKLTLAK